MVDTPQRTGLGRESPVAATVVIPVHNSARELARCLESLRRSDFTDYDCIVVDDASSEEVRAIVEAHRCGYLRLDRRGGAARARNRGAAEARGDILVFFDADVCPRSDTLGRLVRHLRDRQECSAVMGAYDDDPGDPHLVSQFKNLFHHYVHGRSDPQAWTFWTGCGAVRRRGFEAVGGFDESVRGIEDVEFGCRLAATGHRIDLDAGIQVKHLKRWTLVGLIRTDVFWRGVPWMLLLLRRREMPYDLNLQAADRASVVLACGLAPLFGLAAFGSGAARAVAAAAALAAVVILFLLNRDLLRFFARKRGPAFACAAVPLLWLYYAYCGLAVAIAVPLHLWQSARPAIGTRAGASGRR